MSRVALIRIGFCLAISLLMTGCTTEVPQGTPSAACQQLDAEGLTLPLDQDVATMTQEQQCSVLDFFVRYYDAGCFTQEYLDAQDVTRDSFVGWQQQYGCIAPPDDTGGDDGTGGEPDDGGSDGPAITFTNGGVELQARTVRTQSEVNTTIQENGQTLLESAVTVNGVRLVFPTQDNAETVIDFAEALDVLPGELAANRIATFVAGQVFHGDGPEARDNPGCDWFPDTRCTLRCCADHDRCYATNNCGASSWLPFVGSEACDNCNDVAVACIARACAYGLEGDAASDVCYDAACRQSYTCPEDPFDCYACESPCANQTPETCGNGSCDVLENAENCASDCAEGLGENTCCRENDGCPSETPTSCPGDCCCCGYGEVCGPGNLCTPG